MLLREMHHSDLDEVLRINSDNVPAVGAADAVLLGSLLGMSCTALVAEVGGCCAGFCIVLPEGTAYGSPNYRYFVEAFSEFRYVDRIAVDTAARGRGIGAAFYRELIVRHPSHVIALEVNVVPPNEQSMRFHLREGFVEVDELETRPGNVVSLMVRYPSNQLSDFAVVR